MSIFRRDPAVIAAKAAARRAELEAAAEHARAIAALEAQQRADADMADRRRRAEQEAADRLAAEERSRRRAARIARAAEIGADVRTVAPLLLVNAAAIGGQLGYVYNATPAGWDPVARVAVAIGVAVAAESVALYVGWHAHDALLRKAHRTAAQLRRASYLLAGMFGLVNYSHFADGWKPTALAVILGALSTLSPWLWGLHTRRAQHVQLMAENPALIDDGGAEFSPARWRAFPVRSWMARRWSIDHWVRDPREAWDGYNATRVERRERQQDRAEQRRSKRAAATLSSAAKRPRWRNIAGRRPRRMGRPQPQITVVVPPAPAAPQPTGGAAKRSSSAAGRGRPSAAQKVIAAAAKLPGAKPAEIAAAAGVSPDTARRHLNGKNLAELEATR